MVINLIYIILFCQQKSSEVGIIYYNADYVKGND